MKKVNFGYNNSIDNGVFEGIGLGSVVSGRTVGPVSGNLLGVVSLGNDDFLVSEVTQAFGNDENYIGRIIVRDACVDLFPDASALLFIDQQESVISRKLEELLNKDKEKAKIENGRSLYDICSGNVPSFAYECAIHSSSDFPVSVVALKHDVFKNKKSNIAKCHSSFSDMQEIIDSYNQNLESGRSK